MSQSNILIIVAIQFHYTQTRPTALGKSLFPDALKKYSHMLSVGATPVTDTEDIQVDSLACWLIVSAFPPM